jgi:hypothetical protein
MKRIAHPPDKVTQAGVTESNAENEGVFGGETRVDVCSTNVIGMART